MKLSRYTFLTGTLGTLGTAALALAGCGGGGSGDTPSTPTVYDPVPEDTSFNTRKVLVSADKKFELITYAHTIETATSSPEKIIYREYGNQDSAITELHPFPTSNAPDAAIVEYTAFAGGDTCFFWSPTGHKLFAISSTTINRPNAPSKIVLSLIEPSLVTAQGTTKVDTQETTFSNDVLAKYSANGTPSGAYTKLYPTGFSADGVSLLYAKQVWTAQGSTITKYAYNYKTGVNTEVTP